MRIPAIAGLVATIFCLLSAPAVAQVSAEKTGVSIEALQHNYDDYTSFSYSHGQLCQKTLKQVIPGVRGQPEGVDITLNFAGIMTSRWKQALTRPDGTDQKVWNFECVSQIRTGRRLVVLSLVMYEQRGAEMRGVELVTNRNVHIAHELR